jgi:hypothetical protein
MQKIYTIFKNFLGSSSVKKKVVKYVFFILEVLYFYFSIEQIFFASFAFLNVYKGLILVKHKNDKNIFYFFYPKCFVLKKKSYICKSCGFENRQQKGLI